MSSTHSSGRRGPGAHGKAAPDPHRNAIIGIAMVVTLTLPAIFGVMVLARPEPPLPAWSAEADALGVERIDLVLGERTFRNTCSLCHGQNAEGRARLGKPLRNSAFVQEHSDDQLFALISEGRLPGDPENTTGAAMPARGGGNLGADRVAQVVVYLRAIQDPSLPTVSVDAWNIKGGEGGGDVASLVGGVGGIGHDLFVASCSACHGEAGQGMDGLGKPLDSSSFVSSKSDEELMTFIKMGRPIWDAQNTTGIDMPPKGGNPALSDEQLTDIVKYIRSLHQ